jgi:hypothetical protein
MSKVAIRLFCDSAQYHLNRIAALAGTNSEEYRLLAAALEKPPGTGLVY